MTVAAASEAAARRRPSQGTACKPRANCLKPKEISKIPRRFDLRRAANYLKVKTIAEAGTRPAPRAKYDGKHDP
jgi:hypothetical protein